ncbi:MAG: sugar-binding transcriptional regulator [Chloroflexi bacterium]|nr:MAG: sugar-binding transcriptional regulator [Chloroflexota bacterium]
MTSFETIRLIHTVLNLYYIEKMKQAEIAECLSLSLAKVNRLLQQAVDLGYIEFVIRTPFQNLFTLEERLKAIFGLQEAIVVPEIGGTSNLLLNSIGTAAATFLLEHLRDGDTLAITPGTTVQAVVRSIEAARPYNVVVVPILGSVQGEIESDMNYLATQMGERLGGKAYQLHAPAFADTQEAAEMLRSMEPVKKILEIGRNATVALLGIGTVDPQASRFVQFTALSAEEMKNIAEGCGGVGEISAHVYNIDGQPCAKDYADRVIGLSLKEIHKIPYRIGVAGSAAKALPIYGALKGGYLHALITDETAALGVLEIFDGKFHNHKN